MCKAIIGAAMLAMLLAPSARAQDLDLDLDIGGTGSPAIFSQGGRFLGSVNANRYDPDSVGLFGSPYYPFSIQNEFGPFGSQFSPEGVRNPYAIGRGSRVRQ
jgi:hypothetical protein